MEASKPTAVVAALRATTRSRTGTSPRRSVFGEDYVITMKPKQTRKRKTSCSSTTAAAAAAASVQELFQGAGECCDESTDNVPENSSAVPPAETEEQAVMPVISELIESEDREISEKERTAIAVMELFQRQKETCERDMIIAQDNSLRGYNAGCISGGLQPQSPVVMNAPKSVSLLKPRSVLPVTGAPPGGEQKLSRRKAQLAAKSRKVIEIIVERENDGADEATRPLISKTEHRRLQRIQKRTAEVSEKKPVAIGGSVTFLIQQM